VCEACINSKIDLKKNLGFSYYFDFLDSRPYFVTCVLNFNLKITL
jgi:hypothetical protein